MTPKSTIKFKPKLESQLVNVPIDNFAKAKEILRCPLSGKFLKDPVSLNGHVYEREAIEDFLFEHEWSDPAVIFEESKNPKHLEESISDKSSVSPNDIIEVSEQLKDIVN